MKTLKALVISAVLTATAPQVIEENLLGFTFISPYSMYMIWDLNKDGEEDLRVFYRIRMHPRGAFTSKPHLYHQDLNNDGRYDESEMFRFNNK